MGSIEKHAWASRCHVSWPPLNSNQRLAAKAIAAAKATMRMSGCVVDYTHDCPYGWSSDGSNCKASSAYAGVCAYSFELAKLSAQQKEAFALACEAPWPCKESAFAY